MKGNMVLSEHTDAHTTCEGKSTSEELCFPFESTMETDGSWTRKLKRKQGQMNFGSVQGTLTNTHKWSVEEERPVTECQCTFREQKTTIQMISL